MMTSVNDVYPLGNPHYVQQQQYYSTPIHSHSHSHSHIHIPQTTQQRSETIQRKRPKYTRSKTGCLTCRVKKIKCDETKPTCMRCTHGQRDCTWPENVPARKKSMSKKEEDRPSTADSSSVSEESTPPTRSHSPPRRTFDAISLPPLASRSVATTEYLPRPSYADSDLNRGYNGSIGLDRITPYSNDLQSPTTLNLVPDLSYPSRYYGETTGHLTSAGAPRTTHSRSSWNSQPQMLTQLDPLQPYFQSFQERNLIRHYCDHSLSFVMAIPFETNPVVDANLPLIFSRPPGDPASDALRMALLGVAAIHQSFILSREPATESGATQLFDLANSYRAKSKHQLALACQTPEGAQSDAALAATLGIALMDIFSGGRNWLRNLFLAKTLVQVRGGPAMILASCIEGGARCRTILEILSVYDLFACLGKAEVPTVLKPDDTWWCDDTFSTFSYVEHVFGMSRQFIPLFSRVLTFLARVLNRRSVQIVEVGDTSTCSSSNALDDECDSLECQELYNLLEGWVSPPLGDTTCRVQLGDDIYRKTCQIMLLRDILQVPPTDATVQLCAANVIALVTECCTREMVVDLLWPVIIAGSQLFDQYRPMVLQVFESFRGQCCFETDTGEQIVRQVWARLDSDIPGAEWRSVMRDLNLDVLIL